MRVLHLLGWKLKDINNYLDKIKEQGFDAIQISPVQPMKEDSYEWWMLYQPTGFHIGNIYGTKEDLSNLCTDANNKGINVIVDVVCEHMAGMDNGQIKPHFNVDDTLKNNPYFWRDFNNVYNWDNRYEVIHKSMGLPGLDLSNYDLQDIIVNFLNELIDLGVNGFRFDAAKSIALPSEGSDFFNRVIYLLKKYGLILYGEVLFANDYLISEYAKYMKVLTNSEYYKSSDLVKYAESHDSYYGLGYTGNFSSQDISNFYNYTCSKYENTIYFARPFDNEWQSYKVKEANQKILRR